MREVPISNPDADFTEKYLASFREPLPEDVSQVMLQDKLQTGWLAWGKKIDVYRFTGWDEEAWTIDTTSKDGLAIFEQVVSAEGWWQKVGRLLSCWYVGPADRVGGRFLVSRRSEDVSFSDAHRLCPLARPALRHLRFRCDTADHRGVPE